MAASDDSTEAEVLGAVGSPRFYQLLAMLKAQYEQDVASIPQKANSRNSVETPSVEASASKLRPLAGAGELDAPMKITDAENNEAHPPSSKPTVETKRRSSNLQNFRLRENWKPLAAGSSIGLDEATVEEDTRRLLERRGFGSLHTQVASLAPQVSRHLQTETKWVIDPGSPSRMWWDVTGMTLIGYDMITVPMLVFDPKDNAFLIFMAWLSLLFWTGDMIWSVNTGYFESGRLVLDRWRIVKNYVRTWFIVDCLVVGPDWVMTAMGSEQSAGKVGRLLKMARGVRVLRLLRLLKLRRLLNEVYDRIASELMFLVVELVQLLSFILLLNHFVACAWYGIGALCRETKSRKNWLEHIGMTPVYGEDLAWRYTTSLHWSITQFTPASMDIMATNTAERIFSVLVLFWALVALSSVISSVSTAMTVIRKMSGEKQKQFWMLRRYLKQRNVTAELYNRIVKYLEHKSETRSRVVLPGQVALLAQLSEHLSHQLSYETNAQTLELHSLFRTLESELPVVMYNVCSSALSLQGFALDDIVFEDGSEAKYMYFVKSGSFQYRQRSTLLEHKIFCSEPVLWSIWFHRGNLTCVSEVAELIALCSESFGMVMRSNPRPREIALTYGKAFIQFMNSTDPAQLSDVSVMDIESDPCREAVIKVIDGEAAIPEQKISTAWA